VQSAGSAYTPLLFFVGHLKVSECLVVVGFLVVVVGLLVVVLVVVFGAFVVVFGAFVVVFGAFVVVFGALVVVRCMNVNKEPCYKYQSWDMYNH